MAAPKPVATALLCAVLATATVVFLYRRLRRFLASEGKNEHDTSVTASPGPPTAAAIRHAIEYSHKGLINGSDAEVLVYLLNANEVNLVSQSAACISKATAFTSNQVLLQQAGCTPVLTRLITEHKNSTITRHVLDAVVNLSLLPASQAELICIIPNLVKVLGDKDHSDAAKIVAAKVLVNLSVTDSQHDHYIPYIQQLFDYAFGSLLSEIRLHIMRVLVNLSCNSAMLLAFFSVKISWAQLGRALSSDDGRVVLRCATLLANTLTSAASSASLPTTADQLEASKNALQMVLCSETGAQELAKQLLSIGHITDDIEQQLRRIRVVLNKHER